MKRRRRRTGRGRGSPRKGWRLTLRRRTGRGRGSPRKGWKLTLRRRRRIRSTWMNMIIIQMNMDIMRRMRRSKYVNFHTKVKEEKIN